MTSELLERARAALLGLAVGDALGMPTQSLPREAIKSHYGELVDDFRAAPDDHPIAAGMPLGSVTDDTEQAVLLAQLLIDGGGRIDPAELARRLLTWERDMRDKGSHDLLGPSTRRALDELLAGGDPAHTGRFGDTNGAAMRITPVGIAVAADDPDRLVDRVVEASCLTHNTSLALGAAAAVAATVSAALDGADLPAATEYAVQAARLAAPRGHWVPGAGVAERIEQALEITSGADVPRLLDVIDRHVGTSVRSNESIPAAFAVLHGCSHDPWLACRIGASVGGDCDTIAAMAGAMAGALWGSERVPDAAVRLVQSVNGLPIDVLATGLLRLRAP